MPVNHGIQLANADKTAVTRKFGRRIDKGGTAGISCNGSVRATGNIRDRTSVPARQANGCLCRGHGATQPVIRIHLRIFRKVVAAQKAVLVELGFGDLGNIAAVAASSAAVAARGLRCVDGNDANAENLLRPLSRRTP